MLQCPNKNLPEWLKLEELVPDMAYTIWDKNNGHGIEEAPNGEPSVLYKNLIDILNNEEQAYNTKAKFFSNDFTEQYGDWTKGQESFKGLLDANGEPTLEEFGQFALLDVYKTNEGEIIPFEAIFSPSETLSSSEVITRLENQISGLDRKIKGLFDVFRNTQIPVKFSNEKTNALMWYDAAQGVIFISPTAWDLYTTQKNVTAFLHELVHVYTVASLLDNKIASSVQKLYEQYKAMYDGDTIDDMYGLRNIEEFVAELLTNQLFYENLLEYARQRNMFRKMYDFVQEVFNKIVNFITGNNRTNSIDTLRDQLMDFITYNVDNDVISDNDTFNDQTRNTIFMMERYDFGDKFKAENLEKLKNNLIQSLESQKAAAKTVYDPDLRRTTEAIVTYNLIKLKQGFNDDIATIFNFLRDINPIVDRINQQIVLAYTGKIAALSDDQLQTLSKVFIGFYKQYTDQLQDTIFRMEDYKQQIGEESYAEMLNTFNKAKQKIDFCSTALLRMQVLNAQKTLIKEGLKIHNPSIYRYVRDTTHSTTSDISALVRWFGAGDKIADNLIKTAFNILQQVENKVRVKVYNATSNLMLLLEKVKPSELQSIYEVDENGKPTGYFVRDRKYGKFKRDYKDFLQKLRAKYNLDYDQMMLPENIEIRLQYNKERNKWLAEHCERKYTEKYYQLFEGLSEEAQNARQTVVQKILDIKDRFKDRNGIFDINALKQNPQLYKEYTNLLIEKRLLASKFDANGIEKPIGSVDRMIADELWELNQKLNEGLKYKLNREKFDKLCEQKKATLSKEEYETWYRQNTRHQMKDSFVLKLRSLEKKVYGEVQFGNATLNYEQISEDRRRLLSPYRDPFTGEIDANKMPAEVRAKVTKMDLDLAKIRKAYNKKHGITKTDNQLFDIAHYETTNAYKEARNIALKRAEGDMELFQLWVEQNHYQGADGKWHPRSYWTKLVANDPNDMEIVPSAEFSELDDESEYANPNYDRNNLEYLQPKKSLYDNTKAYNEIMNKPHVKALYDALIHLMRLSNSMMENRSGLNEYKMPLVSGSMYRYLKQSGFSLKKLWKNGKLALQDAVSSNNDDVGVQPKVKYAPDGSVLDMIPQYFIKDLETPEAISADLVGIVIMYYQMANDYYEKTKVRGKLENLKVLAGQRVFKGKGAGFKGWLSSIVNGTNQIDTGSNIKGEDTNAYKFLQEFLNMNLYGVDTRKFTLTVKNREVDITKLIMMIKNVGTTVNLGMNFICAATGFFTALHGHLMQVVCGRYYDKNDAFYALKDLVYDLMRHGMSIGKRVYDSLQMQFMDYFEVGSTIDNVYKNSNRPKWLNAFTRHWAFGAYGISDYFVKGQILNSVMYNYRLIDGKFIKKEDYIAKYGNDESAKTRWSKATSFKGAARIINGKIMATDPRNQSAVEAIAEEIGNTARSLAASADGQLTKLQKAQFTANVFGSLCMMHRNYIPGILQDRWLMTRQWDYTSQRWVEGMLMTPLRVVLQIKQDQANANVLKEALRQLFIDPWRSGSKMDSLTKGNLKRLTTEIGMSIVIYNLVAAFLQSKAEKDPEDKWLNFLAFVMMRTQFESFTPYNLVDLYRTIKSPTALFSTIDSFGLLLYSPIGFLKDAFDPFSDKPKAKYIERGAYRGLTPLQKALIKATPFKNVFELNDIPSKRRYWEQQIAN